jgi:hypothetical protein
VSKLTDDELVSIIQAHRRNSLGVEDGELSNERAEALDRYHGRPYGNEMEGRSAVVSRDLSEAIDWAMPAIMRIFTQSGSIAEFDPVSAEDEAQAETETDYVNQVIMKDNAGWIVLHDAIKDTLLLKNGYVKHWWDETEKIEETKYEGLSMEQVQQLISELQQDGAEIEVSGQEEKIIEGPMGPFPVYDIELKVKRKKGKVCLEAVPCEEVRVSKKCRGTLQESPFTEHVTRKTRSDLIEMGMERAFVDGLPAWTLTETGTQQTSRDSVSDETNTDGSTLSDRSMDEIEYCEAYVKVDWDGDGVAELRRVVTVGNKIPDGEEWNRPIPEVALTGFVAKRVPHRHVGESLYDELGDLQEIKTTLMRQLLDNIYRTNNSERLVNERVNLGDFLISLPGGVKRIEGMEPVAGAVMPHVAQPIVGQILPVVDYIDGIKEGRTGINKATTGLDPDVLKQTTKGAFMENLNRASQKVEMITRLIAETGVKEMVLRVHSLLLRYQDKQRIIRMKGKYVPVNPQEWQERTDLTVKVGLGTGNEEDKQRKLMMVADLQAKMLGPLGLVDPDHAFALFADVVKNLGFETPDKYAMSPESPEFQKKMSQPKPPPPEVMVEQIKQQGQMQGKQLEAQLSDQQHQREMTRDMQVEASKQEMQARDTQHTAALEMQKYEMKLRYDDMKHQREIGFQQWKAELDASVAIKTASMTSQSSATDPATQAATGEITREVQQ